MHLKEVNYVWMDFPVDVLGSMSQEDLQSSAELYMSDLLYSNPDRPEHFTLPNSKQIPLSVSTAGFVPLYGEDLSQKVLALFAPEDQSTAVALYLVDRWWSVEDILKTSDPSREGLQKVNTLGERIVLYVLNRIVYRAKEMGKNEVPFLCHCENDFAKVLWKDGEAIGFYSIKPEGSLCNSFLTQCYQLPVMDSLFVRKAHRGHRYGLRILEDFVDCFKEEALGLKYPLSPAMYRVCEQYLTAYPADTELLWEVQSVGGPFQRSQIANKIKTTTYRAEDSSSSLLRESMETEVVTMEETIQGIVTTSIESTEEVVIINKRIKETEGIEGTPVSTRTRSGEFRRKRLRKETAGVSEECLPEKIHRVEETKAVVEAPAAELVADESVEEKEEKGGLSDEVADETVAPQEEDRKEEEEAMEAGPVQNMEPEPMDCNVITDEEQEEGAANQELGEPAALQRKGIHMEDIEMDTEDTVHTVPKEVAKDSAEQEVSPEVECPPVEAALPLEDAHSDESAVVPSNVTAEEEEDNDEEPSPEMEQTETQDKSSPLRDDGQEEAAEEETEETETSKDFCDNAVLLVDLKEVSYQLSEKGGNDQIVEVEKKIQKDCSEHRVETILEQNELEKKVQDKEEDEDVTADESPLVDETTEKESVEELEKEDEMVEEGGTGHNKNMEEEEGGETTEKDQAPVVESRVLRNKTKTPVKKTTVRRSKRLSKRQQKEEEEKVEEDREDEDEEMEEEEGETTEKGKSPVAESRVLRNRTKTPAKKNTVRKSKRLSKRQQKEEEEDEKVDDHEDEETDEDEEGGETTQKGQSLVVESRVLRNRTITPVKKTTVRKSKRFSGAQQMEDKTEEQTVVEPPEPCAEMIVLRNKTVMIKKTSIRRSRHLKEDENNQAAAGEEEEDVEEGRVDEQREETVVMEEGGAKADGNKEIEGEERDEENNSGEKHEVEEENVVVDEAKMEDEAEKVVEEENMEDKEDEVQTLTEEEEKVVEEEKMMDEGEKAVVEENVEDKEDEVQTLTEKEGNVVEEEMMVDEGEKLREEEEEEIEDEGDKLVEEENMADEAEKVVEEENVEDKEDEVQTLTEEEEKVVEEEKMMDEGEKAVVEENVEDKEDEVQTLTEEEENVVEEDKMEDEAENMVAEDNVEDKEDEEGGQADEQEEEMEEKEGETTEKGQSPVAESRVLRNRTITPVIKQLRVDPNGLVNDNRKKRKKMKR
ncbi:trichohyalin-like isoform X2 [Anguilla anguilla]|uniref:trichohyalin-like isoform X2 n=1 Tax=Anguilla anguilla TaxID=7936 RepID=UPI0015AF62C0|nr:trichohyalin-like isoform X2 [Anguilla anguilla]